MEPIRDTFWNVPQWAEYAQYILGFLVLVIFGYGTLRHYRKIRTGKPEKRFNRVRARLSKVFSQAFVQRRSLEDFYPGIMHLAIFWGMVALLLGTIVATIDWDVTHLVFGFQFLRDGAYVLFEVVLDIFGLFLLIGLGMAIYRRYVKRPQRLQDTLNSKFSWDDAYALAILSLIAITGYLVEGLRIAVLRPDWALWSPVGSLVASIFTSAGDPTNETLHIILWSVHGLVAFVFIASVPFTKFFHIFTTPFNIFFSSLQPAGALTPARYRSGPGVKDWQDFTWKQLLDFESCMRCGRCLDVCPAYASGSVLSPRDLMMKLHTHIWEANNGHSLHGDVITEQEVWGCTSCRSCTQRCPAFIDHFSTIVDMRRYLVDEGRVDSLLQDALGNLARYGNSFGQSERMRARWSQGVEPRIKDIRREPAEYLWFVGDYASYHSSLSEITQKTAAVLEQGGIDFGILYDAESNSGNDVRRVGEEGLFEMLVEKNMKTLERCEYQAILTTDPHSYNTIKNEYPFNGSSRPVWHISELLDQLILDGRLTLNQKLDYAVTYHDPCYLGRYNEIYEAPRRVIAATGCRLIEMPRHGDRAYCCGAGGGRIWMEEGTVEERPSEARVREAAELPGVQAMVVTCPKDIAMYQDAVKTAGLGDRLVIKDLIELVYESL